jgi:hypothetical protein
VVQSNNINFLNEIFSVSGTDGVVLDPRNTSTLFQDSAMTIPITASGQKVYAWKDSRGSNRVFKSTSSGECPTWYYNNGKSYLQLNGVSFMKYANSNLSDLNFSTPSLHSRFLSTQTGSMLVSYPQTSTQVSPYARLSLYHTLTNTLETRWNGTTFNSASSVYGSGLYNMIGVSPSDAKIWKNNTYTTNTIVNPITYPDWVNGPILFSNIAGSEKASGNCYGIVIFNRATTQNDANILNNWNVAT